ncbi:hypothetical protein SLEP1_g43610 [Rubroshorea leprosula]|uniref:Uncharacterized protein n=1 Tax=Rubroshorea leprosula TaxID=152421 RepID=A0AAV5LDG8_9ROSI|nr:hypothetical protein SLEP1_g43610 [Rubroshorea leprosula]
MLSPVNSFLFNNVDGDHNIIDNSQDHSTNIGPQARTKTTNIGFGAGATNSGPGAGGVNNNHGPGAGGVNSGPGAGSINASSIEGGVKFGYGDPIPKQYQYSALPTVYADNQMGSILDSMLHRGPSTWFNRNLDFDYYSNYHYKSAAGSGYILDSITP